MASARERRSSSTRAPTWKGGASGSIRIGSDLVCRFLVFVPAVPMLLADSSTSSASDTNVPRKEKAMATCKTCLYLLVALGWIGMSSDAAVSPPQGQASEPACRHKVLMIDDAFLHEIHNLQRKVNQAIKHPEPVLKEDAPWNGP